MNLIKKRPTLYLLIVSAILLLVTAACQTQAATLESVAVQPTPQRAETLILADISEDPAATIKEFQPMADYLAAGLGDQGIKEGRVVVASDLEAMIEYLRTGQVDLYFDSPYPALTVIEEANAVPLLRRWKDGVKEYYTVIVSHKENGVTSLDDLRGHTLAFEEAGSTSGYLLPKAHLVKAGYTLSEQTGAGQVADDEIGYTFAETEENILAWVMEGKVAAGTMQSSDYADLSPEDQDQLVVLAETVAVPRHVALANAQLSQTMHEQISQLLMEMNQSTEGQEVLASFEETSQFDPFPEGAEVTFKELEELFAVVR